MNTPYNKIKRRPIIYYTYTHVLYTRTYYYHVQSVCIYIFVCRSIKLYFILTFIIVYTSPIYYNARGGAFERQWSIPAVGVEVH